MIGFANMIGGPGFATWSPARMLLASQAGALYDRLDAYQDSATPPVTPATTVGDPIGTIVSQVSGGFNWRQATAGNKPTLGNVSRGGVINWLLVTDVAATQSVTVLARPYTLSFKGTGTVTLSGASTAGPLVGTGAANRVSLTFTPSAASLTLTVSGAVTEWQLQLGDAFTVYQNRPNAYTATIEGVPTLEMPYFGGDDYAVLSVNGTGVQELSSTADFFADTGHDWAVSGAFSSFFPVNGSLFGKAGATLGNRTLQVIYDVTAGFRVICRGTATDISGTVGVSNTGGLMVWMLVCNNGVVTLYLNESSYSITAGAAAEESEVILIGARTNAAPTNYITGFNTVDVLLGYAPSASQIAQYMSWARSYYGGL